MSYSLNVSGTKEEVVAKIDEMVAPYHPVAAEAFTKIVLEDLKGDRVSFTASGHDNSCSLSVSSWVGGEANAKGS